MKTKDDTMTSRRQFVSGVTAGLAAALANPAFAQQGARGFPRKSGYARSARAIQQTGPHYPIPASSLSPATAGPSGPCRQNGPAPGPWRKELPGLR